MPNPQNEKFEDLPWREQIDIIRRLSLFPAITVMVFIRRKIGFRLMNPTWLIILTLIIFIFPDLPGGIHAPTDSLMKFYALVMLALGLFHRSRRWRELCRGERWHTYSPGISYLEFLPLPRFLKANRRVSRFFDPALVVIIGLMVFAVSKPLGVWIILSAFFLYVFEQDIYEKQLARDLDILDGMVSAEVQAETVKLFEGKQPEGIQRPLAETAGIPTGLAPDIHRQIQLRRAKRAAAPDNLATETPESRV
jgi:hypothetical protein